MEAPKAEQIKGRALTCMVCKGTLLLNGESLKLHMRSKRHAKQLKLFSTYLDPICFAENPNDDSSGITVGPDPSHTLLQIPCAGHEHNNDAPDRLIGRLLCLGSVLYNLKS